MEKAVFGAGCFWHIEEIFSKLNGIIKTQVGYMGGTTENPTYQQVCTGTTGHVETVYIEYNEKIITYQELVKTFFQHHDPTQINRQGPDIGTQYKSIIFYYTETQKKIANQIRDNLENQEIYNTYIATEITPAQTFYKAEEYHQKYLCKLNHKKY